MKTDIESLAARVTELEHRLTGGRLVGLAVRACVVLYIGEGRAIRTDIGGQGFDFMTRKHLPMPDEAIEALKAGIGAWRATGILPEGWVVLADGFTPTHTADIEPIDPARQAAQDLVTKPDSLPARPAPQMTRRVVRLGR